jgi:hypothetical protein
MAGRIAMPEETPPMAQHGLSDEEREFLHQVGRAITDWAQIDQRLFQIFAAILKSSKQHAAILYYRTNTIGGRLVLVDELVKTVLPPKDPPDGGHDHPITIEWKKLNGAISDALQVRNQLAHSPSGPMVDTEDKPEGGFAITDIWWASYMSDTEKLLGRPPKPELKVGDVKDHVQVVGQLWIRLRIFENTLSTLLAK